jgi:glucosamine-phosphate N-acetyltransferase
MENQCNFEVNERIVGDNFVIRKLEYDDYHKGFFELLQQLTMADKPSYEEFKNHLDNINRRDAENIYVYENLVDKKLYGTISYFSEYKFIHNLSKVGHIEDFVVDKDHRNKKIGSKLIDMAIKMAKQKGCYKIILECTDELIPFYQKFGFKKNANSMQIYFRDKKI